MNHKTAQYSISPMETASLWLQFLTGCAEDNMNSTRAAQIYM